jgi:hypothetical protein
MKDMAALNRMLEMAGEMGILTDLRFRTAFFLATTNDVASSHGLWHAKHVRWPKGSSGEGATHVGMPTL